MESGTPCERCGDMDFEGDVCRTCGAVTGELCFGSERNVFGSEAMPKFIPLKSNKRIAPGLEYGLTVLENLCKKYGIASFDMKAEMEVLLKQIHSLKAFGRKDDIGILAGCCLLHIKLKHNQYISMSDISAKLNCPLKKVYKFSKMIKLHCANQKSETEIKSDPQEMSSISEPPNPISTTEMLESTVTNMFASVSENKDEFKRRTVALSKLAYDCWLMSGRSIEGVVTAAGYLCWKSLNPGSSLTLKQFCSDYFLPFSRSMAKVIEMKSMLLKLGKKIPSCSKDYVNKNNILFHLNYILENSETLRNDLLPNTYKAEEIDKKEFCMYRKVSTVPKIAIAVNLEGRCDIQPKLDVSDIDISDTEINKYIRSEKQVDLIKQLKVKYECDT